jgi:NaMN:DMB phosphoribosyltransferase
VALGAALGDGALAEVGGATTAAELASALARGEEVEIAGPGAGSPRQPRRVSAATMQIERNAPEKCLLLVALMLA